MNTHNRSFPWMLYGAELIGTALLVAVGLSIVILAFGQGSPVIQLIPSAGWRRLITGFLFGTTGALITLSPLGKESGAHINPAVTLGFWLMGKLKLRYVPGYVFAQLAGALAGAVPLMAWGAMGRSIDFGATLPGADYGAGWALLGETATTFALILGLFYFLQQRHLRNFTPGLFPILYAVMVFAEANISGTGTNPARSFGPAVISGNWYAWWVYWLGPLLGTLLAVAVFRVAGSRPAITVAKLHHFEHDRYGVFHS
ncbi:MAG: aquaporin [Gallionella sp.]